MTLAGSVVSATQWPPRRYTRFADPARRAAGVTAEIAANAISLLGDETVKPPEWQTEPLQRPTDDKLVPERIE